MVDAAVKVELSNPGAIHQQYLSDGFVVVRNAIDPDKIDRFLSAYEKVKSNPWFVYYAQSTHICVRPQLSECGFIRESMQNASRLAFFHEFSTRFKDCIYDENVAQALTDVDGHDQHVSWQDMFFDRSTGTIEHQDSWYLDTEPPGNLIGVWYALEDIRRNSGPFFVCPGSHRIGVIDRGEHPTHDAFMAAVNRALDEDQFERRPMLLDKGDILLWHPYLIHGAFDCVDESMSRKSFTSHFYPAALKAKDTESHKRISIYDHSRPKATCCPRIQSAFRFNDYLYNLLVYGLYLKNVAFPAKSPVSMRRSDYGA